MTNPTGDNLSPADKYTDQEIIARTIYGESRGEYNKLTGGLAGLIAIKNVIDNRVEANSWFGKTAREVCLKPQQFSCWNSNDPNYQILTNDIVSSVYDICMDFGRDLKALGYPGLPDVTKRSTHYHTVDILPAWAKGHKPVVQIGSHLFYNDVK